MADPKRYALHLVLRDEDQRVVGELELELHGKAPLEAPKDHENGAGVHAGSEEDGHHEASERRSDRRPPPPPKPFRGRDERPTEARNDRRVMSSEQKKFLFRLAYQLGWTRDAASQKVLETLGVETFKDATREMASKAIDRLKVELQDEKRGRRGANGAAHHG